MNKTPDQKREILRQFIVDRGLKKARWAKDSGVDKNSIYNFLNGYSDALSLETYGKLSRTAGVRVTQLTGDAPEAESPSTIWVVGKVEAGAFCEAVEWPQEKWLPIDVPIEP